MPPTCSRTLTSSRRGGSRLPGQREMPFFLWLRLVTGQRLIGSIGAPRCGHARRRPGGLVLSGRLPAGQLGVAGGPAAGPVHPASEAVSRAEIQMQIQAALNGMDPIDREMIALRHFEELTNARRPRSWALRSGGEQAVHPGPQAASGDPRNVPGLFDRER